VKTKIFQTIHSESAVEGGRRITLEFRTGEERVPAVLLIPDRTHISPGALLLHGYTSRKERMSEAVGAVLLGHGIASLSVDLPLHGERGSGLNAASMRSPFEVMRRWRSALAECALALRYMAARGEIDGARLALVGYSLGAFLGVRVAAANPQVRAIVLAAGGDLPNDTPFAALVRTVADPLRAVRQLAGRPLLMVHGRRDRTVSPEQAERLFAAAGEPKELRWWDAGHVLPPTAIDDAVAWLARHLNANSHQRSG
jgi:uncharacterized protein